MDKQKTKRIKRYISWALVVAMVAVLAFLPVLAEKEEQVTGPQASVLSDTAQLRTVSANIMGGGQLTGETAVEITVPAQVKLTEYLVENGEKVTEGQPIATVDRVTVMTAITQVQETMEYLREQISDTRDDTAPEAVEATAGGTVKAVYGAEGEDVRDVILRDGALSVISLDGLMSVRISRSTDLAGGDAVCIVFSDGTEVSGRVESNLEGILTVTVEDDGYAMGEKVTVKTEDGDRIGSGELQIHNPWNVVAYSGTISRVRVREGETVRAGRTLFNLKDTGHTAEFETLSRQHREYEALMLELFRMYQSETVTAPCDGIVTGVDKNGAYMLSHGGVGYRVQLLANAPNGDDETSYINYVGQVVDVGIDGLILKMNPTPLAITDYKDLSSVPTDMAAMTEYAIYTAQAPVYELTDGEWVQVGADTVAAGDILLFAGDADGNFVWVVRIGKGEVMPEEEKPSEPSEPSEPAGPTEPTEPGQPTEPADPTTPTEPSGSTQPTIPSGGSRPGSSYPQLGGNMYGGLPQEDTFTLYGLETVTVASVTGQDTVSVQITVDELDISHIYVGQAALVTVDALSGRQFAAVVTAVSGSGENGGGNSKFTVELTLEKDAQMLPGMNASVTLTVRTEENVLSVPVAALSESGTKTVVYTGYDEETGEYTNPATVAVGISDGEYVRILSGLAEGQTVYYPYYDTLEISNIPEAGFGFPFG